MKMLSSRSHADGFRRRRYQDKNGEIFATVEVPLKVWTWMNSQGRARNRMAEIERERERKARNLQAESMLAQGDKPLAVAHACGMSERTVRRLAHAMRVKKN